MSTPAPHSRLQFLGAGASEAIVRQLASELELGVSGEFGPVGRMLEQFRAGTPCDVVILTRAQIEALAHEAEVDPATPADLGTVATSIAARAADPAPDISTGAALRAALLAATAIHIPDPEAATAGRHFAKVLTELGIHESVEPRLHVHAGGMAAMRALASSAQGSIGCTQSTEILAIGGVRFVGPLPRGFELATVYTAAIAKRASEPEAARRFVARLGSDSTRVRRTAAGFSLS